MLLVADLAQEGSHGQPLPSFLPMYVNKGGLSRDPLLYPLTGSMSLGPSYLECIFLKFPQLGLKSSSSYPSSVPPSVLP